MNVQHNQAFIYQNRSDFEAKAVAVAKYALLTAAITMLVKQVLGVDSLYVAPVVVTIGFIASKVMAGALAFLWYGAIVSQRRAMTMQPACYTSN